MHGIWLWILVVGLVLVVAVGFAGMTYCGGVGPLAKHWDDVYSGSFTDGPVDLNLTTGDGSITLHSWSEPGYKLILHTRAISTNADQARSRAADLIKVEHGAGGIKVNDEGGLKVVASIELYLPVGPEYNLQAKTGNGAIVLEGGSYATARVHTGNGDFKGTAAIGDLEATTGNGAIRTAATGSGRWTLTTGNGLISVDTTNLGETGLMVEAKTTKGKISMEMGGQRLEQQGGQDQAPLRMSTTGYEQARRQLSIWARTNLGRITVVPGT